jgi:hypothetical protein
VLLNALPKVKRIQFDSLQASKYFTIGTKKILNSQINRLFTKFLKGKPKPFLHKDRWLSQFQSHYFPQTPESLMKSSRNQENQRFHCECLEAQDQKDSDSGHDGNGSQFTDDSGRLFIPNNGIINPKEYRQQSVPDSIFAVSGLVITLTIPG